MHQLVECAELIKPLRCSFRTYLWYSGYVVNAVSHQREVVDNLFWRYAKFIHDALAVHLGIGHGVDQGHMLGYQLRHVLITRRNHRSAFLLGSHGRIGADDIVCLDTLYTNQGQTHCSDQIVYWLNLLP